MQIPSRFSDCALCFGLCLAACNAPVNKMAQDDKPEPSKTPVTNPAAATPPPATVTSNDLPAPTDVAAPPADAERTSSGLASKLLQKGTSEAKPKRWDSVKVNYSGWTTDGKMFDSSIKRGEPASFPVEKVIAGWTEGLQLMAVGEKRRLWIPEPLAYKGQPGRPAGMLVFDVELLEIIPGKEPIPAPDDVAAAPADATKTASGLAYKVLSKGKAKDRPSKYDRATVNYTGWTSDGKMFDSSVQRGVPATFAVGQVIEGWTEGLQLMSPGDKFRLWIPENLAYKGRPGPPAGMLVFDVELVSIEKMPEPPPVPKDVAAAPKDAKKTASGLAYKILKHGTGKTHPKPEDRVEVHYTGWTTDGKMFDSSLTRGRPTTFGLNQVIAGWTEGLQLMAEGDSARFWIPEEIAYKGRPGAPAGMLVFDVNLLKIEPTTPPPAAGPGATPTTPASPHSAAAPSGATPPAAPSPHATAAPASSSPAPAAAPASAPAH
jgi:FKBP-type peptidyl-prolyl cis-trans isomerase